MPINMNELENVTGGQEPMILEQKVVYYDANSNKYVTVIKTEESKMPDIIAQKVTYQDAGGHQYTNEQ